MLWLVSPVPSPSQNLGERIAETGLRHDPTGTNYVSAAVGMARSLRNSEACLDAVFTVFVVAVVFSTATAALSLYHILGSIGVVRLNNLRSSP